MKRIAFIITFLCCFLAFTNVADAQKKKSSKPKTVHVKSYKTKKGKQVKAYKRSKPSRRHSYIMPIVGRKEEMAA